MAWSVLSGLPSHLSLIESNTEKTGANDSVLPPRPAHIPVPTFKANLHRILDLLLSADSPHAVAHQSTNPAIVLLTPDPICPTQAAEVGRDQPAHQAAVKRYVDAVKEVFEQRKADCQVRMALVNVWEAIFAAAGGHADPKKLEPFYL